MAGITLAQAEAQLALWITASEKVAAKQSYSIGNRSMTLADTADIQAQIEFWDQKCRALSSGRSGIRVRGMTLE
jgi:hypothetical protein